MGHVLRPGAHGRIEIGRARVDASVSREGVQRDLLPILEGSTVITTYGPVRTDHIPKYIL